jgi:hypothetical protein
VVFVSVISNEVEGSEAEDGNKADNKTFGNIRHGQKRWPRMKF